MTLIRASVRFLSVINHWLANAGVVLASLFIATMTIVVIAGIVFRYVLNNSLTWVEDVSLIMMVTTAFIVAPYALRTGGNVAIEILISALPQRPARVVKFIIYALVFWVLYRYFFESLVLIERGWSIKVNTLPMQWAWCYMILPVVFAALALGVVERLLRELHGIISGECTLDLVFVDGSDHENES